MSALTGMEETFLRNRTFDELQVGDTASLVRIVERDDIDLFAAVSGDVNPAPLDATFAVFFPSC
jgi:phosphate acetyltransferase